MSSQTLVGVQRRALTFDETVAVTPFYNGWVNTPGCGKDVAVGFNGDGTGPVWRIGCEVRTGGFDIQRWNGSGWTQDSAPGSAAVAIAVDSNQTPWVVNSFGGIFRKTSTSPTSGSWTPLVGCARDIGAGADGSVWMLDCSGGAIGGTVQKWNGSGWTQEISGGLATRIAVDMLGRPWVINGNGNIFYRTSANPGAAATWPDLPGLAADIGITFATGAPTAHAFIVGIPSEPFIWAWQEQPAVGDGSCGGSGAPVKRNWIQLLDGQASRISVGPGGPWVVNAAGGTFRQLK